MSKGKNVLMYAISAVLVVFYLVVLYLGQNPNVPLEYEMYYITHELKDWPGYDNLSYDLGTLELCDADYDRKGSGWKGSNSKGSYSKDDVAYVYYVPTESKDNATFYLNIREYEGDVETKVYAGEQVIGTFDEAGEYNFVIPEIVADEKLVIRFETEGGRFTLWYARIS